MTLIEGRILFDESISDELKKLILSRDRDYFVNYLLKREEENLSKRQNPKTKVICIDI